jgi:ribosomal protein L37AE/L43A
MFCENCGIKIEKAAKFCQNCGKTILEKSNIASSTHIDPNSVEAENKNVIEYEIDKEDIIKCGSCKYVGAGERARSPFFTTLAWICVLFAPLITIIYFLATNKYQCPKCKSTFLGIKNKEGVFVGQRGGAKYRLSILLLIIIIIAIIGILASIVLVSLNTAREKAKEAQENAKISLSDSKWQEFNSIIGSFKISLPKLPMHEVQNQKVEGLSNPLKIDIYTSEVNDSLVYVIAYIEYPAEINTSNPENILEGVVNGLVNSDKDNKLISTNFTYFGSYKAIDFLISNTNQDVSFKGRSILVRQKLYQLYETYRDSAHNDINFNKFINSFQLN